MPRVVFAVTVAMTAQAFLRDQSTALAARGWQVDIVCSPRDGTDSFQRLQGLPGVTLHPLAMERELSPMADIRARAAWRRLLRALAPDVVVASTPKASLLALQAARSAGVPTRIFHVRGLRSEGLQGTLGLLTRWSERAAIRASTDVLVDSPSLHNAMQRAGLLAPGQGQVLGYGSCCGVDVEWFRPPTPDERERARSAFGLDHNDVAVGFIGRIAPDKGIRELVEAAIYAHNADPRLRLVMIGPREDAHTLDTSLSTIDQESWAHRFPHTSDPRSAFWALDILALPSYREGFPITPLEAQACGVPVITTDATGCVDAVADGVTGILVPARATEPLAGAILRLASHPEQRMTMGRKGRSWVLENFRSEDVRDRFLDYVEGAVRDRGDRDGETSA
jgi:glycosyltransferase involved in cell wall biosynthesis